MEACFEELADVGLKAEENSNKLAEVVISRDLLPVISTGFLLIVFQGFTRCFSGGTSYSEAVCTGALIVRCRLLVPKMPL